MSIKTALTAFLKANAGVSAITTKVYPSKAPLTALKPYIVYNKVSLNNFPHMTGVTNLQNERIQIDCYGNKSVSVETLAEAVKTALNGYRGDMGEHNVRNCIVDDGNDEFKDDKDGSQSGTHRRRLDFQFWYI